MKQNEPRVPGPKEPYEPPAIVAEEVFETLALSCAKSGEDLGCLTQTPVRS